MGVFIFAGPNIVKVPSPKALEFASPSSVPLLMVSVVDVTMRHIANMCEKESQSSQF